MTVQPFPSRKAPAKPYEDMTDKERLAFLDAERARITAATVVDAALHASQFTLVLGQLESSHPAPGVRDEARRLREHVTAKVINIQDLAGKR